MKEYIVLMTADHYNALGQVRMLGENGIRPIVVTCDKKLKMTCRSRWVKKTYWVDNLQEAVDLILNTFDEGFIFTGDDSATVAVNNNYDALHERFIFGNAGSAERMEWLMHKTNQMKLAEMCGFNIIPTWKVKVGEIPEDITYPVITKSEDSNLMIRKTLSKVCYSEEELIKAYASMPEDANIFLQKYIEKIDELSYEGFSINHGKETMYVYKNWEPYHIPNGYSPVLISSDMDDEDYIKKSNAYIKESGFEGIFDFEFVIDKDGKRWFLETNWRNDTLGYLSQIVHMPLPVLWAKSMELGIIPDYFQKKLGREYISMSECYDYDVRVKGKLISKRQWWKEYRNADCHLYRGRYDFIPFFIFMWTKLINRKKAVKH